MVAGLFSPIIERGTVIPASRVERFFTMEDNQRSIEVEVFQGEHSLCKDNRKLGALKVAGLAARPAGESAIDVRFTYDLNGLLEVETTVVATGEKKALLIEGAPGRMSRADVEKARAAMERLKFHPREALPNATALARAEALYVELVGPERERLGMALALFRSALERQDPRAIDETREVLSALTAGRRREG
jgi:molecular chaperone HscC